MTRVSLIYLIIIISRDGIGSRLIRNPPKSYPIFVQIRIENIFYPDLIPEKTGSECSGSHRIEKVYSESLGYPRMKMLSQKYKSLNNNMIISLF